MSKQYDVVIVGAGVAGASCAALLAGSGWSVALIEKRAFPRRKVCGECVAATNLELLDALGIGEAFDRLAGPPLERVALYARDVELAADLPRLGDPDPRHAFGRALAREHLDTLLAERAAALGAAVYQPWTVRQIDRADGVYTVSAATVARGPRLRLRAPVVIRAYGSWEAGPAAVDANWRPRASNLFAFKANFSHARLAPGVLPVLAFPGGYGGMVIGDGDQLTLACCIRRDRLQACRARMPGAAAGLAVQAWIEESCAGARHALAGAKREGPWLAVGPIRPGLRAPWRERSGFAVGNAAGEAHPILGEGISMAIQSSWLLSGCLNRRRERLLAGADHALVGREYAALFRRNFAMRLRWAAVLSHLAMRPGVARLLLPVLRHWPNLLTGAALLGGKVRRLSDSIGTESLPTLPWDHTTTQPAARR